MTKKEERFVAGLKEGKSITQAYLDAGYSAASRKIAYNEGRKLKQKPCIQRALLKHGEEMKKRSEITAESLIDELMPIVVCAASNYIRIIDGEISLIESAINDPIMSRAIKQIRSTQYGPEITFYDKHKAIELVAKLTGVDQPKRDEQEAQGVTVVINGDARAWSE